MGRRRRRLWGLFFSFSLRFKTATKGKQHEQQLLERLGAGRGVMWATER